MPKTTKLINKAKSLKNSTLEGAPEFKLVIKSNKHGEFDIHVYYEGVVDSVILNAPHFQLDTPFGDIYS